MRRLLPVASIVIALVAAGCGGGDSGSDGGGSSSQQSSTDGKALFSGKCGACHTLTAAGTTGTFGPNLDDLKPDVERVRNAIENGPGPMPNGLYEGAQADAVAKFVAENAGS